MNRLTAEDIHEAEKDLAATATANNNRDDLELQLDEEEELMREMVIQWTYYYLDLAPYFMFSNEVKYAAG